MHWSVDLLRWEKGILPVSGLVPYSIAFLILLLAAVASPAGASESPALKKLAVPGVRELWAGRTMDGLTVMVLRRRRDPLATIQVVLGEGIASDPPSIRGASELAARIFWQEQFPSIFGGYQPSLEDAGARGEIFVGYDSMGFTLKAPVAYEKELLRCAVRLLAVRKPDAGLLAKHVELLKQELEVLETNPWMRMSALLRRTLFTAHPYRYHPLELLSVLDGISPGDVADVLMRRIHPQNVTVIAVGDLEPAETFRTTERVFSPLAGRKRPLQSKGATVEPKIVRQRRCLIEGGCGHTRVCIGYLLPASGGKEAAAFKILATMLAEDGGMGERVRTLLPPGGNIAFSMEEGKSPGMFVVSMELPGERWKKPVSEVLHLLSSIRPQDVPAPQLKRTRRKLLNRYVYSLKEGESAATLLRNIVSSSDPSYVERYPRYIEQTNAELLASISSEYLSTEAAAVIVWKPLLLEQKPLSLPDDEGSIEYMSVSHGVTLARWREGGEGRPQEESAAPTDEEDELVHAAFLLPLPGIETAKAPVLECILTHRLKKLDGESCTIVMPPRNERSPAAIRFDLLCKGGDFYAAFEKVVSLLCSPWEMENPLEDENSLKRKTSAAGYLRDLMSMELNERFGTALLPRYSAVHGGVRSLAKHLPNTPPIEGAYICLPPRMEPALCRKIVERYLGSTDGTLQDESNSKDGKKEERRISGGGNVHEVIERAEHIPGPRGYALYALFLPGLPTEEDLASMSILASMLLLQPGRGLLSAIERKLLGERMQVDVTPTGRGTLMRIEIEVPRKNLRSALITIHRIMEGCLQGRIRVPESETRKAAAAASLELMSRMEGVMDYSILSSLWRCSGVEPAPCDVIRKCLDENLQRKFNGFLLRLGSESVRYAIHTGNGKILSTERVEDSGAGKEGMPRNEEAMGEAGGKGSGGRGNGR